MKKLNYYLLTHHPLLWNTRAVWVLATAILLHLLFFFGGLASIDTRSIVDHSSAGGVGGESMYTFAVLCSLVVLIVWCVFYLRNNAFKSFYRISRNYLAKEFGIVFLIILTCISFSQSFEWGVKLKVRSITNEEQMVREMNAVNRGMVYVPTEKPPYFILNSCVEKKRRSPERALVIDPGEGTNYYAIDSALVREALRRPGAYSFAHYCNTFVNSSVYTVTAAEAISAQNRQWLNGRQRDSIKTRISQLFSVLQKYGIDYRLNADNLLNAVYSDSLFTLKATVPAEKFTYAYGANVENPFYLNGYELTRLYGFIEDCQPGANNWRDIRTTWTVIGYIALSFSILLLCYRRFSRKVFLISVVGTIVWAIVIGLFSMSGGTHGFAVMLLVLCAVFLLAALLLLAQKSKKIVTGVLLNWHIYLAPFVALLLVGLMSDYYHSHYTYLENSSLNMEVIMRQKYPVSSWVVANTGTIFLANVLVVAAYVAFLFNHWANRWHLMPEE